MVISLLAQGQVRRIGAAPYAGSPAAPDPLDLQQPENTCATLPKGHLQNSCRGRLRKQRAALVQTAWLERLVFGPTPVDDRLIQLWLGIFPVNWRQLTNPMLLLDQIAAIRSQLPNGFADLLGAMVNNAALQISLDGLKSHRRKPNENLGRELLELFSLGIGNYTEKDVIEAARALTGYRLQPDGSLALDPLRHDAGNKTILGRTEPFDGPSLVAWLCQQPATARHITGRVWERLVGPLPSLARIATIATAWQEQQLSLPWLMATLLSTPEAAASILNGAMVREPIDLVIASLSLLGSRHREAMAAATSSLVRMGQGIFEPPSVKGWPVNQEWLSLRWLQARRSGLQAMLANEEVWASRAMPGELPVSLTPIPLLSLSLPAPASRQSVARLFDDPAWQLK